VKPAAVVANMGMVPSLHSPEWLYKNLWEHNTGKPLEVDYSALQFVGVLHNVQT